MVKKPHPRDSKHWQSLVHRESDRWIHSLEELKDRFRSDIDTNSGAEKNNIHGGTMAFWSCVAGYCEALATHKETRYEIFPIPIDALERLARDEFETKILSVARASVEASPVVNQNATHDNQNQQEVHRIKVRAVANAVWDTAVNSSKKDEEHANSIYVCLRGHIDKKSIDCLGSSVATVAGSMMLEEESIKQQEQSPNGAVIKRTSILALSEDHVYERHIIEIPEQPPIRGTCEVAIPGSTKRQKAKRACEIAATFVDKKACSLLTPESSWLYMANHPVVCSTTPTALVPIVANINCNIRSKTPGSTGSASAGSSLESKQLYRLKRELLWVLYDVGAMSAFPFGILELGDCEAMVGSERGEEWIATSQSSLVEHGEPILRNEELFYEAIEISKTCYNDAQVYPYYYAGHYHKDAGGTDLEPSNSSSNSKGDGKTNAIQYNDNEHRFADALKLYSEAARVTSKYRFDTGDCLQLNKHLTAVAAFINEDILTASNTESSRPTPRVWIHDYNARACCFWLIRFLDHLLHWEEWSLSVSSKAGVTSKNPHFCEILQPSHKSFVGKLLQTFDQNVRKSALDDYFGRRRPKNDGTTTRDETSTPVSKRLANPTTLLAKSLVASRVQIKDMDLATIEDDDGEEGRRGRSSKRRRKS